MTASVTLWCDHQGCLESYEPGAAAVNSARRLARMEGWRNGSGGTDWCPFHEETSGRGEQGVTS